MTFSFRDVIVYMCVLFLFISTSAITHLYSSYITRLAASNYSMYYKYSSKSTLIFICNRRV